MINEWIDSGGKKKVQQWGQAAQDEDESPFDDGVN